MPEPLTKSAKRATDDMAHGALTAIRELLDQGGIPRGTFADEQVQNLVALYNQRGDQIKRLRQAHEDVRAEIHETRYAGLLHRSNAEKMCSEILRIIHEALGSVCEADDA